MKILKNKIRVLMHMDNSLQRYVLYDKNFISPTIVTGSGGGLMPYIIEEYDSYGKSED